MDDSRMTMEEYIMFEEEKACKRGKVFDWQTATYRKIMVDDDLHDLSSLEAEFPAIVINDAFAPQDTFQCKSQTVYTAYPNPMDMAYRLSRCYLVFIFSTVDTAYSLNEYSVFDTGINTAYPGEWIRCIDFLYNFRGARGGGGGGDVGWVWVLVCGEEAGGGGGWEMVRRGNRAGDGTSKHFGNEKVEWGIPRVLSSGMRGFVDSDVGHVQSLRKSGRSGRCVVPVGRAVRAVVAVPYMGERGFSKSCGLCSVRRVLLEAPAEEGDGCGVSLAYIPIMTYTSNAEAHFYVILIKVINVGDVDSLVEREGRKYDRKCVNLAGRGVAEVSRYGKGCVHEVEGGRSRCKMLRGVVGGGGLGGCGGCEEAGWGLLICGCFAGGGCREWVGDGVTRRRVGLLSEFGRWGEEGWRRMAGGGARGGGYGRMGRVRRVCFGD
ncbi:hypothetical protein Tco_0799079 [Tanacetum coccineum]